MWLDWVSNLGPLAFESDALPTALRGPAKMVVHVSGKSVPNSQSNKLLQSLR